jgi:SAM-dependent methyltransferase
MRIDPTLASSIESRRLLFAPPRSVDRLEDCFFYHTMELPGFGVVPGHWDLRGRFQDYTGGVEVSGRSVLDVGAATGFLSFEAERLRAAHVVSFDMSDVLQQKLLPFKDKLYYRDREQWAGESGAELEQRKNAYWLCHRLLNSAAEVFYGDIYDMPPQLGLFDVAIVGSVLEHLSDQITAMSSIARLTKETMVVVTPLLETEERIAQFKGLADHPESDFTWWHYSVGVYREVFKMLGFSISRITQSDYYFQYGDRFETRSTIVAVRD